MLKTEEKNEKLLKILSIFVILCSCLLLFPQVQNFIIEFGSRLRGTDLNNIIWAEKITQFSLAAMLCSIVCLVSLSKKFSPFCEKYGERFLIIISIVFVAIGVITRIIIYVKCRSLWVDEAALAENFVSKNWLELLTPPLINLQSAPVLYVIAVKAICSVLGYSEFSLRIFSFFPFIGLLICEMIFLKRILNLDNIKIAPILAITAVLPSYVYYSNDLKPYMGDAFFVVFAILLYSFYTQNKISLTKLTISYLVILGFCSPSVFFIGGILATEFFAVVFTKNKKQIFQVLISGISIIVIFYLYYYWWFSTSEDMMKGYWVEDGYHRTIVRRIIAIFNPVLTGDSSVVWFLVPFALSGIYSLIKQKNKIAYSVVFSMFFVFLASSIGKWPLAGRLWLFLPAIVFIFYFAGSNLIKKVKFILLFLIITYSLMDCLKFAKDGMYNYTIEINPLIFYVSENIKNDEKLYVFPAAKPTFKFKNGYESGKIGNSVIDNIIYGINLDEWNSNVFGAELDTIVKSGKVYLLFSESYLSGVGGYRIDGGLAVLENYGTVKKVLEFHKTPLYYFEAKPD